ncbi:MAG TPA: lysophospholipase [Candidatus Omnitrophota bacterium]|nr:lysophospholipase [Candidatus Omnitrophota bacterium]
MVQPQNSASSTMNGGSVKSHCVCDFFETPDKIRIHYRFLSHSKAKHTLIIIHGYGEHSGRYEEFFERLGEIPAQIAMMDLRGMGRSEGERGDIRCLDVYLQDISAFVDHLQKKFTIPQKFILLGHSFGGLLAIHWSMRHQNAIKLLILSAPFLGLRGGWGACLLNRLIRFVLPKFVYRNPISTKILTQDHNEISIYRKDELIIRKISAHFLEEIIRYMKMLQNTAVLSCVFPVYVFTAGQEFIVSAKAIKLFFERLVAPRKDLVSFPGFYHEIFHETDRKKPFNVLKTIIEDCV